VRATGLILKSSLKRQVLDFVFEVARLSARDDEFEFVDGNPDAEILRNNYDPRQRQPRCDPLEREVGHGVYIVGDENLTVLGGPGQQVRILRASDLAFVLSDDVVEICEAALEAAKDSVIEILVDQDSQHVALPVREITSGADETRPTRTQPRPKRGVPLSLRPSSYGCGLLATVFEIGLDLGLALE
jgi:hypothetical protein